MGIKKARTVDKPTLTNYLNGLNVSTDQILEIDSIRYSDLISLKLKDSTYENSEWFVQNHIQSAQTIIIDKQKSQSIASLFSCNAEQRFFANLTWNKFNELEYFPPLTYSESRWNDSLFSTSEIFSTFNSFGKEKFEYNSDQKKYLVLVFYSLFAEKQSTNLIRETQTYINNCIKDSCQVIYVNMDNYMFREMK